MAKHNINIIEDKKAHFKAGDGIETVAQALVSALKKAASYTIGDQDKPCAILWTDPESLWKSLIHDLKAVVPQLFVFGPYDPLQKSGPAIWLRCVEARTIESGLSSGDIPIFYLPGISRQKLRDIEDCPPELQTLVEIQFRGILWFHSNGKDWTPYAFLTSQHGGLGLDIDKDAATAEALLRAMPQMLKEKLADLQHKKLDTAFFNGLLAPDLPASILNWMDNPDQFKSGRNANEWKAFCQQSTSEYHLNPEKDGELRAAELLGRRQGNWKNVWERFTDAPHRYTGVVALLEKVTTPQLLEPDSWPVFNDSKEAELSQSLIQLKDKTPDEARKIILDLEKQHGERREWVWAEIGRSQLALAMEHLNHLAKLTGNPMAAASVDGIADLYTQNGWETDVEAIDALMCCTRLEQEQPLCAAVRSIYSEWLDISARNLQNLIKSKPKVIQPHLGPVEMKNGRVIIFADGLRFDIAQIVKEKLHSNNFQTELQWDWTPFPSVTATAKPYVSTVADLFKGVEARDNFEVTISQSGQRLTSERFQQLLATNDIQVLKKMATGNTEGKAWTEIGGIDGHGHDEGWKLTKNLNQDIQDITDRICQLLIAGWKEAVVVTDHGWLLLPGGLPKVEMPKFLTESLWGRCAAMKEMATTELPTLPWYWNTAVQIASPPGIGCFKAGEEYTHGGISLQELIVPRIFVKSSGLSGNQSKLTNIKWVGLRCRVTVENPVSGLKVDIRTQQADVASSKVEGGIPRQIGEDGTASLPAADDRDEGIEVYVVLIGQDGHILHSLRTVIGGK